MRRFVGQTTKHMTHHVNSLPLNATWRAQRRGTDFIWTTLGHANVRVDIHSLYLIMLKHIYLVVTFPFLPDPVIPPCMETELVQFPLRMRDWLKNVLLQLYEHDSMSPGFLTPKQRFRVRCTARMDYE